MTESGKKVLFLNLIEKGIKEVKKIMIIFMLLGILVTLGNFCFAYENLNYSNLENEINDIVSLYPGKIGVAVKDLNSDYYYGINDNVYFPAASIIKVPIMVEIFKQRDEGKLTLKDEIILNASDKVAECGVLQYRPIGTRLLIKKLLNLMITQSDNTAAKILTRKVGERNINKTLKKLGLNSTVIRDRTMLSKKVGSNNITTPFDTLKLFELIYREKLMSKESCQEMMGILKAQKMRWGIPKAIPQGIEVAHKTGSLRGVYHDAGIVYSQNGPFILCVFTKNFTNDFKAVDVLREIVGTVYQEMVSS
jgi:beta-lactamase class A